MLIQKFKVIILFTIAFYCLGQGNCISQFDNRYLMCTNDSEEVFFKSNDSSKTYNRDSKGWIECSHNGECRRVNDSKKNLYFETAIAILLNSESNENVRMNIFSDYCNEIFSITKSRSASGKLADINNLLQKRIERVKKTGEHHLNFYQNLEKFIQGYKKSYSTILEGRFEASSEYNKYENPIDYLYDINRYKMKLVKAKNDLDWLKHKSDIIDYNIEFDLQENKVIKELFDEFRNVSGFPQNIDELKKIVERKLSEAEKEEDHIHEWIMDQKKEELQKFEQSVTRNFRFDDSMIRKSFQIGETFENRIEELVKEGEYEKALEEVTRYEEATVSLESILSFQVINSTRKNNFDKIRKMNKGSVSSLRMLVKEKIEQHGVHTGPYGEDLPDSNDRNDDILNDNARDGDEFGPEYEIVFKDLTSVVGDKNISQDLSKETWGLLSEHGEVIGVSADKERIFLNDNGELKFVELPHLDSIDEQIKDITREIKPMLIVHDLENFHKSVEAASSTLMLTKEGNDLVNHSKELKDRLKLIKEEKNTYVTSIKAENESISSYREGSGNFPSSKKPASADFSSTRAIKYALYFGIDFVPVAGNVAALADLINMMVTQKDLMGNDAEALDFTLTALGLLIPPARSSKTIAKGIRALMKFLKNGGDKALGQFLKIARMGIGPLRKFLGGVVKSVDLGIDFFKDVPFNLWNIANDVFISLNKNSINSKDSIKEILGSISKVVKSSSKSFNSTNSIVEFSKSAQKIGIKSEKGLKDLVDLSKKIFGNKIGAVGDIGIALRKSYVRDVENLSRYVNKLKESGESIESIARLVSSKRRELGVKYKAITPSDKLEKFFARNLERYGDKWGPTVDYLRSKGKSWQEIIDSATRAGGTDLGL